jgi:hypothetical protein
MRKTIFLILAFLLAIQTVGFSQKKINRLNVITDIVSHDSLEYRLVILDPGFDSWLTTKPSKDFYTKEYYELKNRLYVSEWNSRYLSYPISGLYDTYIDYDIRKDYRLDLNYRLYYYFRYFEETNNVKLINTGR